jgi:hypothetical protein
VEAVEDAAERGAEPLRVGRDELGVGLTECLELAASRRPIGGPPAVLDQASVWVARWAPVETASW